MWTIDASLQHLKNGTCVNCNYTPPELTGFNSSINIKFRHKNLATFSINNGNEQNITPITFASNASAFFSEITSYKIPNLAGFWNFRYRRFEDGFNEFLGYSELLLINNKFITDNEDGTRTVRFTVAQWFPLEMVFLGNINCKTFLNENKQISGPICSFESHVYFGSDPFDTINFNFPLSGLGDQRIFGESIDGHTFEAIRVDLEEYHESED